MVRLLSSTVILGTLYELNGMDTIKTTTNKVLISFVVKGLSLEVIVLQLHGTKEPCLFSTSSW